ncbi:MAG: peptidoglycan-associated lipoprotein Pal [Rhodobiaceae bacterium]|nr:peptidoglycan-associated lipoprotein Pal [Rhodobiaceae bacterium]MCC0015434.1 peptidoglycan-associated lipoprotein Pal [Rhodobiaceae bacterium]MCC0041001.1 peptidoglycan-associated lipoprotein Pal [Rhodobiaceae bacterium]MCC0053327.1 peptidoglycan-associated lipoprotein Pal [Rhodobiaceae bacterium]
MLGLSNGARVARIAIAIALALTVAACSQNRNGPGAGATNVVPGSAQEFVVNVGDRVFFTTDSSQLTDVSKATLQRQAQWLLQYPRYTFTMEGHADERGTREYNIALGARRAAVTRDYLISLGIPANRMRTVSYGKERPVAVCDNASCWNQNRRAVTVLDNATN